LSGQACAPERHGIPADTILQGDLSLTVSLAWIAAFDPEWRGLIS
jgi:hypothetical protein